MRNKYRGKDIRDRLGGTIVRHKGHPYLCEADDDGSVALYSLEGLGLIARIDPIDNEELDISSLTLGYVNIDHPDYKLAVYLKREPTRQFKQCVEVSRLSQVPLKNGLSNIHHKIILGKGLVDCVLNRYPTFDQAMMMITKRGFASVAISKDIAIKRETDLLKVYLKTDEVGYMKLGTKKLIIPETNISYYASLFLSEIKDWEIA